MRKQNLFKFSYVNISKSNNPEGFLICIKQDDQQWSNKFLQSRMIQTESEPFATEYHRTKDFCQKNGLK